MNAIETLMQEHENILIWTQVVDRAAIVLLQGDDAAADDMPILIDWIQTYADRLHHAKEEKILFRAMEEHLGPLAQKLIRHGMLGEHEMARYHVGSWRDSLKMFRANPTPSNRYAVLVQAGSWADLLRRHAEKENAAVFPFAARMLPAEIQKSIEVQSQAYDQEHETERQLQLEHFEIYRARYLPSL